MAHASIFKPDKHSNDETYFKSQVIGECCDRAGVAHRGVEFTPWRTPVGPSDPGSILAAVQSDIVICDSALVESRRALAGKIRQRHQERRKFTDSIWWKAASPVRMPASALQRLRRDHLKNLVRSLELLVRTREEQLEGLEKHAKALAELATQKDRLLEDLSTQPCGAGRRLPRSRTASKPKPTPANRCCMNSQTRDPGS